MNDKTNAQNNKKLIISLSLVVMGMFSLAFAAVPLYDLFCRVTGYGGTTQEYTEGQEVGAVDRWMTVRFNADISPKLPWRFEPDQKEVRVRVGEPLLASFTAENLSAREVSGTAIYNVTPLKTGQYFVKVQCFCFDQQTLEPGKKVSMPVSFFVDPAIVNDDNLDEVKTITLSYTFFEYEE